jgi:hypothetical protein
MPQSSAVVVENSFINGLVTEATGLNFPEKAVTETYDCIYDIDGSVYRRTGFDLEESFTTKTINRANEAIKTYLWQNVAGDGNVTVAVVQVGPTLYFYETDGTGTFSTGAQATTVTLTAVSGAPVVDTVEAQFCDGNGYLIVTHPYIEPMRISYDIAAHTATATNITLMIRDFEGAVADALAVDARPTSTLAGLNVNHAYNLYNQGWNTTNLTAWDTAQTTMPSNADVMWRFKDASDNFDATTTSINRITAGNTPAVKGHFLLTLSNQDRNTASGLAGVAATTTGFQRPSACAFFSGRVFYSGINYVGFNSKIYFTQIIESTAQYGATYQVNDPTSEDLFDILPSDGGVISIPEAGTIYKMFTVPGGLCVFAANGVWYITGSTGLGFTAVDYAQLKIADVSTISDTSFVNISGYPAWWNSEGIYIIQSGAAANTGQNLPQVKSLTYDTFKTFYDAIPVVSKRFARGFYDKTDGHIRWIYRSTATDDLNATYEYDRVLNYNLRTNAFYPWTISESPVKVHAILSSELVTRPIDVVNVIDGANNVVDGANQVITFEASGNDDQQFDKYLVSYADTGSYKFTFADRTDSTYKDWTSYDTTGVNYNSYLITGFKLRGQGIRKFQSNWVQIYSRLEDAVAYRFQGVWDFANTGSGTGRWSTNQYITHDDLNYSNAFKRLKVRGHGESLQFRLSSVEDQPFDCIGWTSLQTTNGAP